MARDGLSLPVSIYITCYARDSRISYLVEHLLAAIFDDIASLASIA